MEKGELKIIKAKYPLAWQAYHDWCFKHKKDSMEQAAIDQADFKIYRPDWLHEYFNVYKNFENEFALLERALIKQKYGSV